MNHEKHKRHEMKQQQIFFNCVFRAFRSKKEEENG